jgi:tRNA A-37 threonylcarbamoyl transferase component Bud32
MSEYRDLGILLYDFLKPKVEKDPNCEDLIRSSTPVTLNTLFNKTQNPNLSIEAQKYIYALIVLRAQESPLLKFTMATSVIEIFLKLCELLNASPDDYFSSIKLWLENEILACEDLNEFFNWVQLILCLRSNGVNSQEITTILDIKYSNLIFDFPCEVSEENIIEYLTYLKKAHELNLDSTGAFEAIVRNAINWVEETNDFYVINNSQGISVNTDLRGTKIVLGLLTKLKIDDKDTLERIEILKNTYGLNPINMEGDEITSINQLIIEKDPISTRENSNKTVYTYIYKAKIKKSKVEVAIKKILLKNMKDISELEKYKEEADIMRELSGKHKTFLTFYGDFRIENEYYMVMEFVERNLAEVSADTKELKEIQIINIAKNLLEGFGFMTQKNIYHRDVKPQNILIAEDLTPKIIDFGITFFNQDQYLQTTQITNKNFVQGTRGYMSPEQKRAYDSYRNNRPIEKYNLLKSDVYSLGITFYMMCTGDDVSRFEDPAYYSELQRKIARMKPGIMKNLISNMVNLDPNMRLTFVQLKDLISTNSITKFN